MLGWGALCSVWLLGPPLIDHYVRRVVRDEVVRQAERFMAESLGVMREEQGRE